MEDKRSFTRVPFITQIMLSQGEQLWLGHVVDISFKGILVANCLPFKFNGHEPVLAEISFGPGISMRVKAAQSSSNGHLHGFRFLERDVERMKHLRHIVMLNLRDDVACERELTSLFNNR